MYLLTSCNPIIWPCCCESTIESFPTHTVKCMCIIDDVVITKISIQTMELFHHGTIGEIFIIAKHIVFQVGKAFPYVMTYFTNHYSCVMRSQRTFLDLEVGS